MRVNNVSLYYSAQSILKSNFKKNKSENAMTVSSPNNILVINNKKQSDNYEVLDIRDFSSFSGSNYSSQLKNILDDVSFTKKVNSKGDINFVLQSKNRDVLSINSNIRSTDYQVGFMIGKAGLFATVVVKDKFGKYSVILPENSGLHIPDKLDIKVKQLSPQRVCFKGQDMVLTMHHRKEKIEERINSFLKKMNGSNPVLASMAKSPVDYSKQFEPFLLAAGFGSRLEILSNQGNDNKPSTPIPAKDWSLMDFNLLAFYKSNLLGAKSHITYDYPSFCRGPLGSLVHSMGYEILKTDNSLELKQVKKSSFSPDKNIIILPADSVSDIDFAPIMDKYLEYKDAGMLLVGVPISEKVGGLMISNKNNELLNFIEKPDASIDLSKHYITCVGKDGKEHLFKNADGKYCNMGNAFIHIINPDIAQNIIDIYARKINGAYQKLLKVKPAKDITDAEMMKVVDGVFGRDLIPELIKESQNGNLKDKNGQNLKVYVYPELHSSWLDAGSFETFYDAMTDIASKDKYTKLSGVLKNEINSNIKGNIIFNSVSRERFEQFLGDGTTKGKVIVMPFKDKVSFGHSNRTEKIILSEIGASNKMPFIFSDFDGTLFPLYVNESAAELIKKKSFSDLISKTQKNGIPLFILTARNIAAFSPVGNVESLYKSDLNIIGLNGNELLVTVPNNKKTQQLISDLRESRKYSVRSTDLNENSIRLLVQPNIDKKFVEYSQTVKNYFEPLGLTVEDKGPVFSLKWRKLHNKIENSSDRIYSCKIPSKIFSDLSEYCRNRHSFEKEKTDFRLINKDTQEILDLNFKDDFLKFVINKQKYFYNQLLKSGNYELNSSFTVLEPQEYKTKTELLDFKKYNKGTMLKEIFSLYGKNDYLPIFLGDTLGTGDDEFAMREVKKMNGLGIGILNNADTCSVKNSDTDAKFLIDDVSETLPLLHKIVDIC